MELRNKKITIIGTGRLAWSLAYQLIKNGFIISHSFSRSGKSAEEFARKFKIPFSGEFKGKIPDESKVVFLTVNDASIESTAKDIASLNKNLEGKIFIHFSGAYSSTLLKSLKKKKALTASFHIMQTFPSKKRVAIKNSYTAVETSDDVLLFSLFNFASQLKLRPFRITPENKTLYHMAGVFTSNFLISHFYNAEKIYSSSKIEAVHYFNLFDNILEETIRNLRKKGYRDSLSGPVVRGDITTIKDHIALLKKKKEFILLISYLIESLTLADVLLQDGGERKDLIFIQRYLKKELKEAVK